MDDPINKAKSPTPLHISDFEAIETAMMETDRGRWFLAEFANRNKTDDTQILLAAIAKLETAIKRPARPQNSDNIRADLMEMSRVISDTRHEIAAMKSHDGQDGQNAQFIEATEELDAIVRATEKATNHILEAAEEIQETAWIMREQGADAQACDRLDGRATDIYTACSFQDITGQRISKVVNVLNYLEERVNTMIEIWEHPELVSIPALSHRQHRPDAHLLNGPQHESHALDQEDVDTVMYVTPQTTQTIPAQNIIHENTNQPDSVPQPTLGPAKSEQHEEDTLPAESLEILDQLARSNEAEPAPQVIEEPVDSHVAEIAAVVDALHPQIIEEAYIEEDEPQQSSDNPDDLLAGGPEEYSASANTHNKPWSATQHSNDSSGQVVTSDNFEAPEPLTLSALGTNGRAALFC